MDHKIVETPVLIIGGSLVGLSAAMFLAHQNVPFILVEKHSGSSLHPRAVGYTTRTIELYRATGIEDQLPKNQKHFQLKRTTVESMAGKWEEETVWTPGKKQESVFGDTEYSPVNAIAIAQDGLEPILRKRALELGADLRLGTEMLHFTQTENGVTAIVKERESENEYTIHSQYMIATDGNDSPVRETLGIGRKGRGLIKIVKSVLFSAPALDKYLESGISQFEIEQEGLKAFLTTYRDSRWVLMFTDDKDRNEEEEIDAIKKAIGRDDVPFEIITRGCWNLAALITDKFSEGRIFIAGDAAHTLPPTRGGYGANTGIHDVHNLGWKLKAVLNGTADKSLLDTYHEERYPAAWNRYQQTFIRPDYAKHAKQEDLQGVQLLDDVSIELGQLYRSKAVIGADKNLSLAKRPDEWNGQPGTRAAHIWMLKNGEKISTLDLFQNNWVLLSENEEWCNAFSKIGKPSGYETQSIQIGKDVMLEDVLAFRTLYGIDQIGACLVRPDGYIACRWASKSNDFETELLENFKQVAFLK